ncbi:hypothetical protein FB451DRAFT_1246627 [Mycena latifolia]|nr:hypothetical protein FB451DRAFT_1246627 [Mycena latifolia]
MDTRTSTRRAQAPRRSSSQDVRSRAVRGARGLKRETVACWTHESRARAAGATVAGAFLGAGSTALRLPPFSAPSASSPTGGGPVALDVPGLCGRLSLPVRCPSLVRDARFTVRVLGVRAAVLALEARAWARPGGGHGLRRRRRRAFLRGTRPCVVPGVGSWMIVRSCTLPPFTQSCRLVSYSPPSFSSSPPANVPVQTRVCSDSPPPPSLPSQNQTRARAQVGAPSPSSASGSECLELPAYASAYSRREGRGAPVQCVGWPAWWLGPGGWADVSGEAGGKCGGGCC